MASDWTEKEICDLYYFENNRRRNCTLNIISSLSVTGLVVTKRGTQGFIPIGKDRLARARLDWERKNEVVDIPVHPLALTDDQLQKSHFIIKEKRKSLLWKPFVAYHGNIVKIYWVMKKDLGVTDIRTSKLDQNKATSDLSFYIKIRYNNTEEVEELRNYWQGLGWVVAPYEHYINKVEIVTLHLPYKVKFFDSKDIGKNIKKDVPKSMQWIDFEISTQENVESEEDRSLKDDDGCF